MEKWQKVATYLAGRLADKRGVDKIDLLTLNKVMYFAQRESYIREDKPLFQEDLFHAAQFGPVIIELKGLLNNDELTAMPSESWVNDHSDILIYVVDHYGIMSARSLSDLSHGEISWRNARDRATNDRHYEVIYDKDIRIDALKIRLREASLSAQSELLK